MFWNNVYSLLVQSSRVVDSCARAYIGVVYFTIIAVLNDAQASEYLCTQEG